MIIGHASIEMIKNNEYWDWVVKKADPSTLYKFDISFKQKVVIVCLNGDESSADSDLYKTVSCIIATILRAYRDNEDLNTVNDYSHSDYMTDMNHILFNLGHKLSEDKRRRDWLKKRYKFAVNCMYGASASEAAGTAMKIAQEINKEANKTTENVANDYFKFKMTTSKPDISETMTSPENDYPLGTMMGNTMDRDKFRAIVESEAGKDDGIYNAFSYQPGPVSWGDFIWGRNDDTYYILHLDSGITISFYKHIGRGIEFSKPLKDTEVRTFFRLFFENVNDWVQKNNIKL